MSARSISTLTGNRGLTLVELMIAMALGLFLLLGVVSVFLAQRQAYRTNENLAGLQNHARVAFELMAREIRESGLNLCGCRRCGQCRRRGQLIGLAELGRRGSRGLRRRCRHAGCIHRNRGGRAGRRYGWDHHSFRHTARRGGDRQPSGELQRHHPEHHQPRILDRRHPDGLRLQAGRDLSGDQCLRGERRHRTCFRIPDTRELQRRLPAGLWLRRTSVYLLPRTATSRPCRSPPGISGTTPRRSFTLPRVIRGCATGDRLERGRSAA